jgi:hypothetical protein
LFLKEGRLISPTEETKAAQVKVLAKAIASLLKRVALGGAKRLTECA